MQSNKQAVLDREERWAQPVAIATLVAVVISIVATVLLAQAIGSTDGDAEYLRLIDQHRGTEMVACIMQAIGALLLVAPLLYLFRADQARSEKMRGQLVGIVIAAPLFLMVFNVLVGVSALHAATDFIGQGVAGTGDHANKVAQDAINAAPLQSLAAGFGIGGRIGFVVAMFYSCLYGLRTGLLTRFWGSLGMALGAVSFIFPQFALLWFIYFGLLVAGWVPGGRPPAWAAAEAIPWPTPGEKVATQFEDAEESDPPEEPAQLPEADPNGDSGESRRKRKQRD